MTDCLSVHHYNHKTIIKLPVPSRTGINSLSTHMISSLLLQLYESAYTSSPLTYLLSRTYDTLLAMSSPLMTAINHTMGTTRDKEDLDVHHGYYVHNTHLGEGGFGKVFLATHLMTSQKVAIKRMNKKKLGSDIHRVKIEINALKVLNHKNIAQLLQVVENRDNIYLVLEYCSDGELFDYLVQKRRLTEEETKVIFRDLADVLNYIHTSGFAHRDLKPENILFDKNHRIKLIDFGLAAHCRNVDDSQLHLKTCCGSPAYAAPELLKNQSYSGPAVDVWSAGVLLYCLLVGQLPFESTNLPALYKKIMSGVYSMPQHLSADAKQLIRSMLQTDPKVRATISDVMNHQWLRVDTNSEFDLTDIPVNPTHSEVLEVCQVLKFPRVSPIVLERQILCDFGYKTATFRLIKSNPQLFQSLKAESRPLMTRIRINRRRSRSAADMPDDDHSAENSSNFPAKRKMDIQTLKDFQIKKPLPNNSDRPKARPLAARLNDSSSPSRIPAFREPAAKRSPLATDSIRLVKARMLPSPPAATVHSVVSPNSAKNARVLAPINESTATPNRQPLRVAIKTPNLNKTPNNSVEKSEKKSLIKRLLASATPTKRTAPRVLRQSVDDRNITRTPFTDPQTLIEVLMEILAKRRVQCTKKANFMMKCVLSSMNIIVLAFTLEVCLYEDKCVIIRKRLKGDSWDYMKICEDLKDLQNVTVCENSV